MKKNLFIVLLCGISCGIFAQENEQPNKNGFLMFLHGGYGLLPNKTGVGLTNPSADYVQKLASGGAWNAQAYFRTKMFIVGLMYAGYASKGSAESYVEQGISGGLKTSDNILTTYIAPQLGMHIPAAKNFDIGWNAGIGGIGLKNKSKINGNPRILKGSAFACNLGVRGVYNFNKNFGLSAEVMYIFGHITRGQINYHDYSYVMDYFPVVLPASQFTFSLGFKYSL